MNRTIRWSVGWRGWARPCSASLYHCLPSSDRFFFKIASLRFRTRGTSITRFWSAFSRSGTRGVGRSGLKRRVRATPLLGNPTAAVLYPGKVAFFLLPHPWAMRVFVIGHVALAFGAMWALLRAWRVSTTGSILGSLAYGFGVPVLSQTSNLIFLVGAAWAPLGFLAADRWVRCGRRWALPALTLVLALQVLGGDPEAAYLTFVCAMGYAAGIVAARPPSVVGRVLRWGVVGFVPVYLGLAWPFVVVDPRGPSGLGRDAGDAAAVEAARGRSGLGGVGARRGVCGMAGPSGA